MTTSKALDIIFEYADYNKDYHTLTQWREAMSHIVNQLGVVFDEDTEQWVTADEGHPV
jgi:hypothetical protein